MTKLEYTFKTDTLFKILFVQHPELLKKLVSLMLGISHESISQFEVINPEIQPGKIRDKFCRLDINMMVDGQQVDLEIQVKNEKDYPERVLFNWALEYTTAITVGEEYLDLPRTVVISIINFKLFSCAEYHSEYQALEVSRHDSLTDKMSLHFFELPKIPRNYSKEDMQLLWLLLFKAETAEELDKIKALGVPEMEEAINAYNRITVSPEFREQERARIYAQLNEASALGHARREEREKWQGVVAEKDAENARLLADKDAEIARLREELSRK